MATTANTNKVLLVVLAFLLPPAAVALRDGIGTSFIINLVLTLFMWIPGVIHALMVIL
ncbi:MAG: YqaE/Pmp3 family membrane protein [Akkermansiaceae bacterium]|nr:YqaE/Pmp3 family membrane protein [Akkermansiaceae bacterium]MCP5545522.1 YqaE/Pmp3 family membrane protein [Akkermansiaceae bacterium]MCP5545771.1 YqaE/Pmp3 family membrane protein [Akkermansiaceae bacterium]